VKRELILVAASGLAREVIEAVNAGDRYQVSGVVDDDPTRAGGAIGAAHVIGGLRELARYPNADVVVCAGKGSVRRRLVERLSAAGIAGSRFATVVHPSVQLPDSAAVGRGSVVLAGCVLTADVTVGRHVVVMPNVTLTHDVMIEDFATLCAGVTLGGSVRVGERSYIGMAASIRENCLIGADATIGMGSVVLNDIPPDEVWLGVPARPHSGSAAEPKERQFA
jgi:sugar O-acyltransferase (sialic acid O-acetyltransferase NeuD family)